MFHAKDGWFFQRNEDGSVSIIHNPSSSPDQGKAPDVTIDASVWASVVASVSRSGEENGRFYEALRFHDGVVEQVA